MSRPRASSGHARIAESASRQLPFGCATDGDAAGNVHAALRGFHPAVASWFAQSFAAPTAAQVAAWPSIASGRDVLIAAPTGSGKTLAAFLAAIDALVREGADSGALPDATSVVYVSPLKALSNDIAINLEAPLAGIRERLLAMGLPDVEIRTAVRTGDTPQAERTTMRRKPPHILVTTPESLYVLLGSDSGRAGLATARTVIVDEIHAVAASKRGSHLALSLARLDALCVGQDAQVPRRAGGPGAAVGQDAQVPPRAGCPGAAGRRLARIGLSATQKPIDEVARFLVGVGQRADAMQGDASHAPTEVAARMPDGDSAMNGAAPGSAEVLDCALDCAIVDIGHDRARDLAIEMPPTPLTAVMANEVWEQVYARLAELVGQHRTTLIFVNTRRMAERAARHLSERLGKPAVAAHHGSLAREHRLDAEQRLKRGELRVLVATASLELGIDIGEVELVCQLGSPRSIAAFLQRVGRSGHTVGGMPKGRLFPSSRDELVECAALLDCVRRGELDLLRIPRAPLDVLAQQIVAEVGCRECGQDELFNLVRRAYPYARLERTDFDAVVRMLADGFSTRRGTRAAWIHRDAVHRKLRGTAGGRLTALTSGGTIPDTADYSVVLEPRNQVIGSINEDFAIESIAGDIFQLGNASYRILRVERDRVRVEDAHGAPPNIPFWLGEAPGRSDALSVGVSRLREEIDSRLADPASDADGALRWLIDTVGVADSAATQLIEYLAGMRAEFGMLPTRRRLAMERFFDESGGAQLVIHSPYGSRINRAWGLALRKRFCRGFNFELQAAATEDAIVLSLSTSHSFPLADVAKFLHSRTARDVLVQALLDAPLFPARWRWNATTALALPRFVGGAKVAPQLQRMKSEDLLASVFPDQVACLENIVGERRIPDHPLVAQTLHDCLHEAMDADGWLDLLRALEAGEVSIHARDLTAPSPFAAEVLNARPYAFLDDAPLEERRTRAVLNRRWTEPENADDLGRLDPEAIAAVRDEAWPQARNADEMHEALLGLGVIGDAEACANSRWPEWLAALASDRRATRMRVGDTTFWVAAERLPQVRALHPHAPIEPDIAAPEEYAAVEWSAEDALTELLRARLSGLGPTTVATLAATFALPAPAIDAALLRLEAEGYVMRGQFDPGMDSCSAFAAPTNDAAPASPMQWCERHLLARIHRYAIGRLRREIEPVAPRDYLRFAFEWQRIAQATRMRGSESLDALLAQFEGYQAPAGAWESELLPARIADYDPSWLDALCQSGRIVWTRLRPGPAGVGGDGHASSRAGPVRSSPIVLLPRRALPIWSALVATAADASPRLSSRARLIADYLRMHGASFFDEIVAGTRLLQTEVENALGELVAQGVVVADSFSGLRTLIAPANRRQRARRLLRQGASGIADAGRWSLVRNAFAAPRAQERTDPTSKDAHTAATGPGLQSASVHTTRPRRAANPPAGATDSDHEHIARVLLRRYGVVCRQMLDREAAWLPPWRILLRVFHRLEARGEIRGGRFIDGLTGEQFALPEAIGLLRQVRRREHDGTLICVSGADPLNLVGSIVAGTRVPAIASARIAYRDGQPIATRIGGQIALLEPLTAADTASVRNALLRYGAASWNTAAAETNHLATTR